MGVVLLDGFSVPAVGQVIQDDFDNLDVGVIQPGAALLIAMNMGHSFYRWCHGESLRPPGGAGKVPRHCGFMAVEKLEGFLFRFPGRQHVGPCFFLALSGEEL